MIVRERRNFSLLFYGETFLMRNEGKSCVVVACVRQTIYSNLKWFSESITRFDRKREWEKSSLFLSFESFDKKLFLVERALMLLWIDMQSVSYIMETILISSYFHSGAILNITILLTRSELGGSKRTIKILCPHKHAFYALFAWLLCRTSLGFSFFYNRSDDI